MNTTMIKTAGVLKNSRIITSGCVLLDPTGAILTSPTIQVYTRTPNAPNNTISFTVRTYDGEIGTASSTFTPINTEIIDDVTIRTYNVTLTSESTSWNDRDGNTYIGRNIYLKTTGIKRLDLIGNDFDLIQNSSLALGYNMPLIIDAEQLKYSDIPQDGLYLYICNCTGVIKTEWFKNNTSWKKVFLVGDKVNVEGTIMDFVNSYNNLEYINFLSQTGVYGDIREFLNALKAKGLKGKTVEIRTSSSNNITNDVTPNKTPVYATFDANGDWTASNSAPA